MKRQAHWLVCAVLMVAMVLTLVACGHQHTYTDDWSYDATNHWHKATCAEGDDCAAATGALTAHEDTNGDKLCDVCGYDYNHSHTYATNYSSDATGHWYAVTCGCSIAVKDKAAHVDADNDGTCDTEGCGYNGGHEHTFAETLAFDGENHWYPATCDHSIKKDEVAHTLDAANHCAVCGYVEGGMTVENAVNIGKLYGNLINGGTIVIDHDWIDGASQDVVSFAFGPDYVEYLGTQLRKYCTVYNGKLFVMAQDAIWNEDGWHDPYVSHSEDAGLMIGYAYNQIVLSDIDDTDNFFGTEALVSGLYQLAKAAQGFEEHIMTVDGQTVYTFSFQSGAWGEESEEFNWDTYEYETTIAYFCNLIDVAFTIGADGNYENVVVSTARRTCEPDATVAVPEGEEPSVFVLTGLTSDSVTQYTITQTVGERTLVSKYHPAALWASEIGIYNGDTKIDSTFEVTYGEWTELTIKALAPLTADLNMDLIEITCNNGLINPNYWGGDSFNFTPYALGDCQLTVTTAQASYTFNVVVKPAPLTSVDSYVLDADGNPDSLYGEHSFSASADGSFRPLTFGATPNAGVSSTVTLRASLAATQTATLTSNGDGTYTFTATASGTYTITFTAIDGDVTVSTTVTVIANEYVPPVLPTGEWEAWERGGIAAKYTMTFEGSTVNIGAASPRDSVKGLYDFAWNETTKRYELSANGEAAGHYFVFDEVEAVWNFVTASGTVTILQEPAGGLNNTDWEYYPDGSDMPSYMVTFFDDGTGTLSDNVFYAWPSFEWEMAGQYVYISFTQEYSGELANAFWLYYADTAELIAVTDSGEYVFTLYISPW